MNQKVSTIMPGNELLVAETIFTLRDQLVLPHFGVVREMGYPLDEKGKYALFQTKEDIPELNPHGSAKKADFYINGVGTSVKQSGSANLFNRLQRANLIKLFSDLGFGDPSQIVSKLDEDVDKFHKGSPDIKTRNRPWVDYFSESEFSPLLEFLMMRGSPNLGVSNHPADLILVAPKQNISAKNIEVYDFNEYFQKHKGRISVAIRRQWVGQASDSEHKRALGLSTKFENKPWVYDTISGTPNLHPKSGIRWRPDVTPSDRRTVYLLFLILN
jgi:hypothetical protein